MARRISSYVVFGLALLVSFAVEAHPASAADFSTLIGKHIAGYQGWFACPTDPVDPRWSHWFQGGQKPGPLTLSVDLWPDLSGFDKSELCPTGMTLPSGAPAYVFSSENAETVRRHFHWMHQYGIDGVAVQRFMSQFTNPRFVGRLDLILHNIRAAAEAEDRGFFVMYDLSGLDSDAGVGAIESDWTRLVQAEHLTASPSYMHHRGRPVVGLWGLGVGNRKATAAQAMALIHFFKDEAKVTLFGGVPTYWRTLGSDSHKEPAWNAVYRSFDILSPWTVGRFRNPDEADAFARNVMAADMKTTRARGQDYMPVIFPGFSWHNLQHGKAPLDQIPRLCGAFYREQAINALKLGANMLYSAMFDELDEGTALLKIVRQPSALPAGAALLAPDADHCPGGNDLYLHLAGQVTGHLHQLVKH
jgi:hypothetical protein